MDTGSVKDEVSPVMGVGIPRRYTDESADALLNAGLSKRLSHQTSFCDLLHERITLTWENLNVHLVSGTQKDCFRRCHCCDRNAGDAQSRQILHNGSYCPNSI